MVMTPGQELLADLERAMRAGSAAAETSLLEPIRNGSAHVVQNARPAR
jgi:hypothetical protein